MTRGKKEVIDAVAKPSQQKMLQKFHQPTTNVHHISFQSRQKQVNNGSVASEISTKKINHHEEATLVQSTQIQLARATIFPHKDNPVAHSVVKAQTMHPDIPSANEHQTLLSTYTIKILQ